MLRLVITFCSPLSSLFSFMSSFLNFFLILYELKLKKRSTLANQTWYYRITPLDTNDNLMNDQGREKYKSLNFWG